MIEQLKLEGLRFCKVRKATKKPFEKNWTKKPYTYQEIEEHITNETNYGVLCGYGGLVVIDCDKQELSKAIEQNLPRTFTVKTGGGGTHFYYICKEIEKKIILTIDNKHYGEVQSHGTQVVGAGSIHPNKKKYEVLLNENIKEITKEQLLLAIKPFMEEVRQEEIKALREITNYGESDINSISILQVMNTLGFKKASNGEYYGTNPWHGSETGMNTWINANKNVAHCFRCDCGINVAQAIALNENIINKCSDKLSREQFIKVLEIAQQKHGLKKVDLVYKKARGEIINEGVGESAKSVGESANQEQEQISQDEIDIQEIGEEDYTEINEKLNEIYFLIKQVLKRYCDLDERYYNIIALWIIGTYFHKLFITYPYLYFNAMKGSGKTRILRLISHLMKNGKLIASISEAVLFRTAKFCGFCIDEFERLATKEKAPLRELLNCAYKRGMNVQRVKKAKVDGQEQYVVEEFPVFTPICMANIWGIEEVLEDRSVVMILEKTSNLELSRMLEIYDTDDLIMQIKGMSKELFKCSYVVKIMEKNIYTILQNWNVFLSKFYNNIYNTTLNYTLYTKTANSHNNFNTHTSSETTLKNALPYTLKPTQYNLLDFFNKIAHTQIDGRGLELFMPLLIIANFISKDIFDETLETSKSIVSERKTEDIFASNDISLIDFLARKQITADFIPVRELLSEFKGFLGEDEDDKKSKSYSWLNSKWLGRALKRLKLVVNKRRLSKGIEVTVNFNKAKKQMLIFKTVNLEEKYHSIEKKEKQVDKQQDLSFEKSGIKEQFETTENE